MTGIVFIIESFPLFKIYHGYYDKYLLANHKWTASHYIINSLLKLRTKKTTKRHISGRFHWLIHTATRVLLYFFIINLNKLLNRVSNYRLFETLWRSCNVILMPFRFSTENRVHHGPFDHLPFGYGPRNCIAMRLAHLEVKMVAAHILRHFTVCTGPKTQVSKMVAAHILRHFTVCTGPKTQVSKMVAAHILRHFTVCTGPKTQVSKMVAAQSCGISPYALDLRLR